MMDDKKIARINELAHKSKAEGLTAENYTAESYAKLTAALTAAKEVYNAENKTDAEIQAQITAISDAIKGLESADKAANEDLKKQLEEKIL